MIIFPIVSEFLNFYNKKFNLMKEKYNKDIMDILISNSFITNEPRFKIRIKIVQKNAAVGIPYKNIFAKTPTGTDYMLISGKIKYDYEILKILYKKRLDIVRKTEIEHDMNYDMPSMSMECGEYKITEENLIKLNDEEIKQINFYFSVAINRKVRRNKNSGLMIVFDYQKCVDYFNENKVSVEENDDIFI